MQQFKIVIGCLYFGNNMSWKSGNESFETSEAAKFWHFKWICLQISNGFVFASNPSEMERMCKTLGSEVRLLGKFQKDFLVEQKSTSCSKIKTSSARPTWSDVHHSVYSADCFGSSMSLLKVSYLSMDRVEGAVGWGWGWEVMKMGAWMSGGVLWVDNSWWEAGWRV